MAPLGRQYGSSNGIADIVWYFIVLSCNDTVEVILGD